MVMKKTVCMCVQYAREEVINFYRRFVKKKNEKISVFRNTYY